MMAATMACALAACMGGPRETEEQVAGDRNVVDAVQAEFNSDQTLFSRHITVRAREGVVTLGGYAWTPEEISAATQDAERASGVTKVVNNIQVDRGAIQDSGVTR